MMQCHNEAYWIFMKMDFEKDINSYNENFSFLGRKLEEQ